MKIIVFLTLALLMAVNFDIEAQTEVTMWDYFWLEALAGTAGAAVGFYGSFGLEQMGVCGDGLMCAMTLNAVTASVGVAVVGGLNGVEGNLWLAPVGGLLGSYRWVGGPPHCVRHQAGCVHGDPSHDGIVGCVGV